MFNTETSLQTAIAHHKRGEVEKAEELYKRVIDNDPKCSHAFHNLGNIYRNQNRMPDSNRLLAIAVSLDPNILQFWVSIFNFFIQSNQSREIIKTFEEFCCYHKNPTVSKQLMSKDVLTNLVRNISHDELLHFVRLLKVQTTTHEVVEALQQLNTKNLDTRILFSVINDLKGNTHRLNEKSQNQIKRMYDQKKFSELLKKLDFEHHPGMRNERLLLEYKAKANFKLLNYKKVIQTCMYATTMGHISIDLLNLLAVAYSKEGNYRDAELTWKAAIEKFPTHLKTFYNLAQLYEVKGDISSALTCYAEALTLDPEYLEALFAVGKLQHKAKNYDKAISTYLNCLKIKPDFELCKIVLATLYNETMMLQDAKILLASVKTLSNDGLYLSVLGNHHFRCGDYDLAIQTYKRSIKHNGSNSELCHNLAMSQLETGAFTEAVRNLIQAIKINPKYIPSWDALPVLLACFDKTVRHKLLNQIINMFSDPIDKNRAQSLQNQVEDFIFNKDFKDIKNFKPKISNNIDQPLPVFALYNFGRSGTGMFHSLLDGHEQILTTPSIFFSDFFRPENFSKLTSMGRNMICEKIFEMYPPFFDARRPEPTASVGQAPIYNLGITEGLANLGPDKNEVFVINKSLFKESFNKFLNSYEDLNAANIFFALQYAYDECVFPKQKSNRKILFYHIHNPNITAEETFLKQITATNIFLVREPLQSMESWIRQPFNDEVPDYPRIVSRIAAIFRNIASKKYDVNDFVGIKLEEIKNIPVETLTQFCEFVNVDYSENLLEMTVGGKRWWGDPQSVDFKTDGMNPFGKKSINRKLGTIFSDDDLRFFEILLVPFKTNFGYELLYTNKTLLATDLKFVTERLNKLLDFETVICAKKQISEEAFRKTIHFTFLRMLFKKRLDEINEFSTYSSSLRPFRHQK